MNWINSIIKPIYLSCTTICVVVNIHVFKHKKYTATSMITYWPLHLPVLSCTCIVLSTYLLVLEPGPWLPADLVSDFPLSENNSMNQICRICRSSMHTQGHQWHVGPTSSHLQCFTRRKPLGNSNTASPATCINLLIMTTQAWTFYIANIEDQLGSSTWC